MSSVINGSKLHGNSYFLWCSLLTDVGTVRKNVFYPANMKYEYIKVTTL